MPNMVQITEPPRRRGDDIEVRGTVDGVSVTIHVWQSHLATLATAALRQTYVRQQLKAAYLAMQGIEQPALVDAAPVST